VPEYLGIARDTRDELNRLISDGMQRDVLILSGGVSAGKLDLVPEVLTELGVESHVHKVMMKPGKPLFFGTRGAKLIFGLPGNPLSSFVGFELFVAPALRRLMGIGAPEPQWTSLPLTLATARGDRPTYHPSRIEMTDDGEVVAPLGWKGSADLRRLCDADALALIPAGSGQIDSGSRVQVLRLSK
jgi:molybdopterin molybdotransferase